MFLVRVPELMGLLSLSPKPCLQILSESPLEKPEPFSREVVSASEKSEHEKAPGESFMVTCP